MAKKRSFHTFYFPDEVIKGDDDTPFRFEQSKRVFSWENLKGKTCLDVGSWSGAFAFAAESYGASRVLATDWFCWDNGPGPGTKYIFDYVKKKLNSKVEELEIDVPNITIDTVGKFDIILLLGITYHLPSILTSIVNLCELANESVLIESAIDLSIPQEFACSRLYIKDIYCNDSSNFFIANPKFYEDILYYCGFKTIRQHLYKIDKWDRLCIYGER